MQSNRSSRYAILMVFLTGLACSHDPSPATEKRTDAAPSNAAAGFADLKSFRDLRSNNRAIVKIALKNIERNWHPSSAVMLLETAQIYRVSPQAVFAVLQNQTGQNFGLDHNQWYRWLWAQKFEQHPQYATFKAEVYRVIDPRFAEYFDDAYEHTIDLTEIRWGGVRRDGIPPLDNPATIPAEQADWLKENHIVFGVVINGQARCYPKRILGWHEMVKDNIGGKPINGVYCTLCGSMIVYDPVHKGTHHVLGTSGFLYRSNKLMYDQSTKSMWSTLEGRPVVGPLVGRQIKLERLPVVTTTWGQWRKLHPETTVLSLNTGHQRDYGEGVAYHDYFATDELMFTIPKDDKRLLNKQSVLTLRTNDPDKETLAISTDFLKANPLHHDTFQQQPIVVLTDTGGGSRAYACGKVRFREYNGDATVRDGTGEIWQVTETALVGPDNQRLKRIPTHEAFWFGWHSQFPETRLVK